MAKIAFCDDDWSVLHQLSDLTDRYRRERECDIEYAAYQSPLELLSAIERGLYYDVIFMDVLMPGENGMEAAQEIRAMDATVKIIFLTSSQEFAVQSYTVGAFYYHLKPIQGDNFFRFLDQVLAQCVQEQSDKLVLKVHTGIAAISPARLEYCEVMNHTLLLHLSDGQVLKSAGNLDDLTQRLSRHSGFLRFHRSYLVNMAYIQHISSRTVTLTSGVSLPLPHGKFGEVKNAFLAYAFEKGSYL